jgi:CHASE3 domain sensor protein
MTIQNKLWLMTFVSLAALGGVFSSGKMGIDSCQVNFDQVVDERVPKMVELQGLNLRTAQAQSDVREYVLVKDSEQRAEIEKRIQGYRSLNKIAYQFIETHTTSAQGRTYYDAVINARAAVVKNNDEAMALIKSGKDDAAIALITSKTATEQNALFRQNLQKFVDYQIDQTKKASVKAIEDSNQSSYWMILISLLATLLLITIAVLVMK